MSSIKFENKGDFSKTEHFLEKLKKGDIYKHLDQLAQLGVTALKENTPIDTGKTSISWDYEVKITGKEATISWINTNVNDGENVAILLQYGHGTGTGGYVHGRDYINPAMKTVFDKIAEEVWKEVMDL